MTSRDAGGRTARPVVGIVGSQGAFGRWLKRFFESRMGLEVIGRDPAGDEAISESALIARADVLVFSAPIRVTRELIARYTSIAAGSEKGKLWLDITSIKSAPVEALLQSQAEVVGLHPMTAPPKTPTLKGRILAVCESRVDRWHGWLARFLEASEATVVRTSPERHDRVMALVQGMVHATHMAQGAVLREMAPALDGLDEIALLRTLGYELDGVVTRRMLAGNPAIYEDIQFENPHVASVLGRLAAHIDFLRDCVRDGSAQARAEMRSRLLEEPRAAFGAHALSAGSYEFERLGYLLADLAGPSHVSVFLPLDRPGSLRALLAVFEELQVNLESIHSSRTADGELHFRIGLDPRTATERMHAAAAMIVARDIGRVLS
ncbi:MAG: prephenate dehydrogenase [Rudaea sp.]